MFVTVYQVPEVCQTLNNGDWFGEWPMQLYASGADPERGNRTPGEMVSEIRGRIYKASPGWTHGESSKM